MSIAGRQRRPRRWRWLLLGGAAVMFMGSMAESAVQQQRAATALREAGYREFVTRPSRAWRCPWGERTTDFVNHHGEPTKGYVCTSYLGEAAIHALPDDEPLNIDDH